MTNKTLLEDILSLGGDALSQLMETRREFKDKFKEGAKKRAGSVLRELDIVSRDEFDAAFAMLAKARNMQEDLAERIARIETHLNLSSAKAGTKKTVKTKTKNLPIVKTKRTARKKK